ncbi:EamA family transporter [Intestinibacter sp.]|uniref:EamA family transporter n=1 Tax=Intestinibacter sp. TaxID=1965304 RepID=UPI003F16AFE5
MWILYAFASSIFAGLTAILSKIGIKSTDSNLATAIRTTVVLAFSCLMVFIVGSQDQITNISIKTMSFLILSGLATGGSWLCYFRALQLGNVNKVTPIDKSSTILTMILAIIFLGEKITAIKAICIVLIGIGTYMMIEKKDIQQNKNEKNSWLLYAILSAVFASLTSILGKVGIEGIESNLGTSIRTVVVLIMAWIIVFATKKQSEISSIDKKSWIYLILSGFATGGSWLCYYKALQEGPASVVVPIDKLSILVTIGFSYIILKEKLNKKSAVGLILIVTGTLLLLV